MLGYLISEGFRKMCIRDSIIGGLGTAVCEVLAEEYPTKVIRRKQVRNMSVTEQNDRKHQEDLERLRGFRLMDDDFLTKCFEGDTACIELLLLIVLEQELQVLDVRTQVFVENLLKIGRAHV